jgi:hypothetical protein
MLPTRRRWYPPAPEVAWVVIQCFRGIVTDLVLAHCGDIKGTAGDEAR